MCILIFPQKIWAKKCTLYVAKYSKLNEMSVVTFSHVHQCDLLLEYNFLEGKGHVSYLFCSASSIWPHLIASVQLVSNDPHLPSIQTHVVPSHTQQDTVEMTEWLLRLVHKRHYAFYLVLMDHLIWDKPAVISGKHSNSPLEIQGTEVSC